MLLQTSLLPHLQLRMFSFSLSAYVWMRPTCWAPMTASSWERRRLEKFEHCCGSCLWKHHKKQKAAASSRKAELRDCLSALVWMKKTAALRTCNKLFFFFSSPWQRFPQLWQCILGDHRADRSHEHHVLTDPATLKASSSQTPWQEDHTPSLVGHWGFRLCPASQAQC